MPSRLKAWIDSIIVAGKTFKYTETGTIGLVNDKKCYIFKQMVVYIMVLDPASQYVKTIFTFLGVTDFHQLFVEGMDYNPDKTDTIVSEAIERAKEIANVF
ncbi:NAD(P)H-dependent oxidoreductase [Bacillus andreraoultii]|uniref:NAD(P)H-dependent oxidoreductase n=1 Tax=Bacillus andreraoultii TaxID=1499685 RepID=UPI001E33B60D|nr:NAD(P)H-dependent oxidoreductase [Bacillus andreraoultii]